MLSNSPVRNARANCDATDGSSHKMCAAQSLACSLAVKGGLLTAIALLMVVFVWQISAITKIVAPAAAAPVFCGPGLLHTMSEPPEIQLTRDYVLIKVLLYAPGDHYDQVRRLYDGSLRALMSKDQRTWLAKRSERARLFKRTIEIEPGFDSLRREVHRLDRTRGTAISPRIEAALADRNRIALEAGFRDVFVDLVDELLSSIQQRLDDPVTAVRVLSYVRRYYAVSLEAYLALNSPVISRSASASLDAMARALQELNAGTASAAAWFDRERQSFAHSIRQAVEDGRRATERHTSITDNARMAQPSSANHRPPPS